LIDRKQGDGRPSLDKRSEAVERDTVAGDTADELKRLKQDYLELDRIYHDEKGLLIRILQTLGTCVSPDPEVLEHVEALKAELKPEAPLDQEHIEAGLDLLKRRIRFLEEAPGGPETGSQPPAEPLMEDLREACLCLRKIMLVLLEDFYPMRPDLKSTAQDIQINCSGTTGGMRMAEASTLLLNFIDGLKDNINGDFREINNTLFSLLDHVKELEGNFSEEFGDAEGHIKQIEYFEMKVNSEVGSLVKSFDIHTTVTEIKQAVISKINNIRTILSNRKKEEMTRAERFQKRIDSLKTRIQEVERDAQEMSQRAEHFETAAKRDKLTGLCNRSSFDDHIRRALKHFNEGGAPFALILFDVDKFKEINDTLGHVAGDKVLQKVAACLRNTFRKNDFIARYGGDEFVVIIQDLTIEMAREKISLFLGKLRRLRFTSHARGDITVGVSPGIAVAREGDSTEDILNRADQAMYETKKRRR